MLPTLDEASVFVVSKLESTAPFAMLQTVIDSDYVYIVNYIFVYNMYISRVTCIFSTV